MTIIDPRMTGQDVAKRYAEIAFAEERKVAEWRDNRFRLVDGLGWYAVIPIFDNCGKQIGWRVEVPK